MVIYPSEINFIAQFIRPDASGNEDFVQLHTVGIYSYIYLICTKKLTCSCL